MAEGSTGKVLFIEFHLINRINKLFKTVNNLSMLSNLKMSFYLKSDLLEHVSELERFYSLPKFHSYFQTKTEYIFLQNTYHIP